MDFNITCLMTKYEVLQSCHNYTVIPSLISLLIFVSLFFWLSSILVFNKEKTDWVKVLGMFFLFIVLCIVAAIFIMFSPNFIETIFH